MKDETLNNPDINDDLINFDSLNNEEDINEPNFDVENLNKKQLWDEIGFHKLLAGFWYNITYTIIGIILSATLMGVLMNTFYPFPESMGYKDIVWATFSMVFVAFDLGTGMVMDRYIARENISNPAQMVRYIQYFIWYQAITGLIQVTGISIYALYIVPETAMAYTIFLMLIAASTQYPGFLGVFKNVLDSLQHFNKSQLLSFLTGTLFQRLSELLFIYIGSEYGKANPEIGQLMGIAIGAMIGLYIDDFLAMIVAAKFFATVMSDYGIRPRDCMRVDFTWEEVKEPLIYGIKTGAPGLINSILGFTNFMLWLTYLPQFTTYVTLAAIGTSIPSVIDWFGTPRISPLLSESYQNDKKELTQYYIGQFIRFHAQIKGFFIPILIAVTLVMPIAWTVMGMINYIPGLAFIIPGLVLQVIKPYLGIPQEFQYAVGLPNFAIITGFINSFGNTLFLAMALVWLRLPIQYPDLVPWLYVCFTLPVGITISALNYRYVHKNYLKFKVPFKQIFFGFICPSFITYILVDIVYRTVFLTLNDIYGFYIAAIVSLVIFIIVILLVYFPLSGLFGGWDDENLNEFEKAAYMSGPSKPFAIPVYNMVEFACKKSKFHNKFGPDMEIIEKQARELLLLKLSSRDEYIKNTQ